MTNFAMPRETGACLAEGAAKGTGYVRATVCPARSASPKHVLPQQCDRSSRFPPFLRVAFLWWLVKLDTMARARSDTGLAASPNQTRAASAWSESVHLGFAIVRILGAV